MDAIATFEKIIIILFGSCDDCGEENANPRCGIGMTFSNGFGSAGFLANSTRTDETGFLTAAHVVVRNLEKLYVANVGGSVYLA